MNSRLKRCHVSEISKTEQQDRLFFSSPRAQKCTCTRRGTWLLWPSSRWGKLYTDLKWALVMVFYNSNRKVTMMGSKESVQLSWWIDSDIIDWQPSPLVQNSLSFIVSLRSDSWIACIPRKQGDLRIWRVLLHAAFTYQCLGMVEYQGSALWAWKVFTGSRCLSSSIKWSCSDLQDIIALMWFWVTLPFLCWHFLYYQWACF